MTQIEGVGERGSLSWAVRDSLIRYVTVIARGSCTVSGAAGVEEGEFVFPLLGAERVADDWHFAFTGTVRLTAHHGFMDITLADPEITIGPGGGVLTVRTGGEGAPRIPVAATEAAQPHSTAAGMQWKALPSQLLESATDLFGGTYTAGTELAPVTITAGH